MMDLSQAMDFCSCWMHMASWAALRTSLKAFLHTFIPWATSSSPLGEKIMSNDGKVLRNRKKKKKTTHIHAHTREYVQNAVKLYQLNQPPTRQQTIKSSSCAETGMRFFFFFFILEGGGGGVGLWGEEGRSGEGGDTLISSC